jgi:predicted DNA-binding transcriptional regulator AlpA
MSLERSPARQGVSENAAFTIPEFCAAHRIGRTALYKLWAEGLGPRKIQVGNGRSSKIVISIEAAADWRTAMEKRTDIASAA